MGRLHIIPRQCLGSRMEFMVRDSTQQMCCTRPTPSTVEISNHPDSHPTQIKAVPSKAQAGPANHPPSTTTTRCHPAQGRLDTMLHLTLLMGRGVTQFPRIRRTQPSNPCRLGPSLRPGPTRAATAPRPRSSGSREASPRLAPTGAPSCPRSLLAGRAPALQYHRTTPRNGHIQATPNETSQRGPNLGLPAAHPGRHRR